MSERELPTDAAIRKIRSIIHSLDLKVITQLEPRTKFVATASLFDKNGNLVEFGSGKGPDALVGALAESIEHHCTFHETSHSETIKQRGNFIAAQGAAKNDGLLSSLADDANELDCFKLTALDKKEDFFVPKKILHPHTGTLSLASQTTPCHFLDRYSSNSGIAFGCTEAEALLHGTLEVIERHILSRLFMSLCSIGDAFTIHTASEPLIEDALLHDPALIQAAKKLKIVVITDFFNVFFAMAFPTLGPGDMHLSAIGSGCSLDIKIAVQRAISEQLQAELLYGPDEEISDRKALELISSLDNLRPLIDFHTIKTLHSPAPNVPAIEGQLTVRQQLKVLQHSMTNANMKIYNRVISRFGESAVTQIYIPGLERFNMIRNGCWVVPQHILLGKKKSTPPTSTPC